MRRHLVLAGAATVAVIGLAACGGGNSSGSSPADWKKKHGDLVAAYSRDLTDAINNVNQGSRDNTLSSCTQVAEDGKEVRSKALPAPDAAIDAALRKAVDTGAQAAADCLKGGRNTDARAVEAAQREFAEARKAMDEAEAGIKALP